MSQAGLHVPSRLEIFKRPRHEGLDEGLSTDHRLWTILQRLRQIGAVWGSIAPLLANLPDLRDVSRVVLML